MIRSPQAKIIAAVPVFSFTRLCIQKMVTASSENCHHTKNALSRIVPLEAVLFDVDGTLCDSDPLHYSAFREMLLEMNFNNGVPITKNFFVEKIAGKHNSDIATLLFPGDPDNGKRFMAKKEEQFRRLALEQLKPVNGLLNLKKWIECRGIRRAAVTNAPRENAYLMIEKLGLSNFFQTVILGDECQHAKPHPDPYLKALDVLKVSKEHTLIFEDSTSGIKAGVSAGMPVIALSTGNPEASLIEAGPDFVIKDYEDEKLWDALDSVDDVAKSSR